MLIDMGITVGNRSDTGDWNSSLLGEKMVGVNETNSCSHCFNSSFDQENSSLWLKSNWRNYDSTYLNTWLSDPNHIIVQNRTVLLNLDDQPCVSSLYQCQNQSFASGEFCTRCVQYLYGTVSAKILAGKGNGIVTGLYLFGGTPGKQDEIDVEIFGKDPAKTGSRWEMQTNYFVDGSMGNCWEHYGVPEPCHVAIIPLDFDPTVSYHIYKILWIGDRENCSEIKWYVDDKLRRDVWLDENKYVQSRVFDENGNIIETGNEYKGNLPTQRSKICSSLWAAGNWSEAGNFSYSSEKPIYAKIDWISYSQLNDSSMCGYLVGDS